MTRRSVVRPLILCFAFGLLLVAPRIVNAEKGNASGVLGAEDFKAGALPPPGFYLLSYGNYYVSEQLKDDKGNLVPGAFRVRAPAYIARVVYITKNKIFGADFGVQAIVPIVNLNLRVPTPGGPLSGSNTGVADIVLTPLILGWHLKDWHLALGVDAFLSTGSYDKNRVANVGRNYVSSELAFAFSYLSPKGLDLSGKLMYDLNARNKATDYTTGHEFHFDGLVGYRTGPWSVGVNFYGYTQTRDDEVGAAYAGPPITNGNRGQVFAIGPAISFEHNHVSYTFKYQKELGARNRPEGHKVWLKVALRLG